MRPNLHIDDVAEFYRDLLETPAEKIEGQIFNVAYENFSIGELADMVKKIVSREMPKSEDIALEVVPSDDNRSYHVCSNKVKKVLGWEPKRTLEDAVVDLCNAFKKEKIPNSMTDARYFNVKAVQNSDLS